jgi:hypothetical protein
LRNKAVTPLHRRGEGLGPRRVTLDELDIVGEASGPRAACDGANPRAITAEQVDGGRPTLPLHQSPRLCARSAWSCRLACERDNLALVDAPLQVRASMFVVQSSNQGATDGCPGGVAPQPLWKAEGSATRASAANWRSLGHSSLTTAEWRTVGWTGSSMGRALPARESPHKPHPMPKWGLTTTALVSNLVYLERGRPRTSIPAREACLGTRPYQLSLPRSLSCFRTAQSRGATRYGLLRPRADAPALNRAAQFHVSSRRRCPALDGPSGVNPELFVHTRRPRAVLKTADQRPGHK